MNPVPSRSRWGPARPADGAAAGAASGLAGGGADGGALPAVRLAASMAHQRLRDEILSGRLSAGAVISQVQLAAELGISRTPLREALRMLQEEGLIDSEPNRRSRVASFDPADLDATYGSRLLLEALGMRLTVPTLRAPALERASGLLAALDRMSGPTGGDVWHRTHHQFHGTFLAGAPQALLQQMQAHAQRSERYMSLLAHAGGSQGQARGHEHHQLLELVVAERTDEAVVMASHHLARTPLLLLTEVACDLEPAAIRAALSMIGALNGGGGRRAVASRSSHPGVALV